MNTTGAVNLGGADLDLTLLGGYTHSGATHTIIANDGTDAVNGTFAGLAEGATFTVGGNEFRISYAGGSGNDVTLTAVTPPTPEPNPDPTPEPPPPDDGPTVAELLTPDCQSAGAGVGAAQPILAGPTGGALLGTEGEDMILGAGGPDEISGLAAADCLRARGGKDEVDGGTGRDVMYGGAAGDRMDSSSPERDQVFCGKGRDRARISPNDRTRGCERIKTV